MAVNTSPFLRSRHILEPAPVQSVLVYYNTRAVFSLHLSFIVPKNVLPSQEWYIPESYRDLL